MNASVEEKLKMPGLALAATGALGLLFALLSGLMNVAMAGLAFMSVLGADMGTMVSTMVSLAPGLIYSLITVLGPVVTLLAGLRLKAGTSPNMVYAGAIMAMIPCCNTCCFVGIFTGAFAIYTMQDEEVKAAMADA